MKKKYKFLSLLMAASVACTATFAGCALVSADAQADMQQVIAEVDISKSEKLDQDLKEYAGAITSSTEIYKRELIAYFLNSGSSLVQGGSTYGEAFETLANALVNNEVLIQYATLSTLKSIVEDKYEGLTTAAAAVEWFNAFKTDAERYEALLAYQAGKDDYTGADEVNYADYVKYSLMRSLNASIDSYEESNLEADTSEDTSTATVPGGVDTETEYYYPVKDGALDYDVYTGYGDYILENSGIYKDDAVEGTTLWTRRQAYNDFIQVLDANYLVEEGDNIADVWALSYVQDEYVNLMRQQLLSNYYDLYEKELETSIEANEYSYITERYNEMISQQKADYDTSAANFETAMGEMSDSSFVLYAPETKNDNAFGYVYNILLPFSSSQTAQLSDLSAKLSNDAIDEDEYYYRRNLILQNVTTVDQRSSWFNGGVDYSFNAEESGFKAGAAATEDGRTYYNGGDENRNILFFEDNLTNSERYESLDKYLGLYSYNGTAVKNEDGTYTLIPNRINIDGVLSEFKNYIGFVLGDDSAADYQITENYFNRPENGFTVGGEGKDKDDIDYSKFIYAAGKVNFGEFVASDLLNEDSDYYKVLSAVNELQYAYTTDTAVLSEYVGYSVSAYSTSYIKEFEYAAQEAIKNGAGSFAVCAGDYGWHLIYVSYVFGSGNVYGNLDWAKNIDVEGTFEYEFYNSIKTSDLENASTRLQSDLLQSLYQTDKSVTKFEDRYSDLTSLTTSSSSSSSSGSSTSTGSSSGSSGTTSSN